MPSEFWVLVYLSFQEPCAQVFVDAYRCLDVVTSYNIKNCHTYLRVHQNHPLCLQNTRPFRYHFVGVITEGDLYPINLEGKI